MTSRNYPAVIVAAMLVLTALASMPVAASSHDSVTVETVGATDVTTESATIVGNLTELDNASSADVWFEYWEEGDPANTTTTSSLNQTSTGEFEIDVDGLESDTTYVAVAHAETENASAVGAEVNFTTDAEPAVAVETGEATDVTNDSATLGGELTALAGVDNATVWFEYWQQGDSANRSTTANQTLDSTGSFNAAATGLSNNTTYVFEAHAVTDNESDTGNTSQFTTLDRFAALGVDTLAASDVDNDSATLNGELTGLSGEAEADVWFEYWPHGDSANASTTATQNLSGPGSFSEAVSGLEDNTTYVYVAHASANNTTVSGDPVEFTTGPVADETDRPTWDGEGPFGQWLTSVLRNLVPPDSGEPLGQIVSDIVTANNPGSEHRSDKANPGGNGNGPPDHAKSGKDKSGNGPPDHAKGGKDKANASDDDELEIAIDGDVAANETVNVTVTHDGSAVENATVWVDGEEVGTTDADGELEVTLPDEPGEEITISAEADGLEGEIEVEL